MVQVMTDAGGLPLEEIARPAARIIEAQLAAIANFSAELGRSKIPVC